MPVEADCPVCDAASSAKEIFAIANVSEHIHEKARRDEKHQVWIDEHTENGTLTEVRDALCATTNRPR